MKSWPEKCLPFLLFMFEAGSGMFPQRGMDLKGQMGAEIFLLFQLLLEVSTTYCISCMYCGCPKQVHILIICFSTCINARHSERQARI